MRRLGSLRLGLSLGLSLGLLLAVASVPAAAAVQAWLDSNAVAPGDSVRLTLQIDGETGTRPDLAPLQRDFDVLGTSSTTSVQILNGSTSSQTQVEVTLSAKHAGRLTIPSITWDGERSPPLALDVSASAGGTASSGGAASQAQKVFLETQFGPAMPYVQAAVSVTVRLYTREALYDPQLTLAGDGDFVVRQVGSDEQGTVQRGGQTYEVVTRHYVVFPQRSGHLSLPGAVLEARVAASNPASAQANGPFGNFFSSTPFFGNVFATVKPIRLRGNPISLDVEPRPAGALGSYWLPASGVTLKSDWHPAALEAHAGDPVTVDLTLEAVGLTAAQLPDLSQLLGLPQGLKSYPDEPKLSDTARGDTVVGTREQTIALIADQAGHFTIPALRVTWWDTRSRQARETDLPARTLTILPAANTGTPPQSTALQAGALTGTPAVAARGAGHGHAAYLVTRRARLWLAVSAVLALAWLVTLAAWLRSRRRLRRVGPQAQTASAAPTASPTSGAHSSPSVPEASSQRLSARPGAAAARAAFRLACKRNDAAGARRYLLAWVAAEWLDEAPLGLNALARRVEEPDLAALLRDLDRACYTGEPWRGEGLAAALGTLPRPSRSPERRPPGLTPLYPSN